jgi:hypothetical protein
MRNRNLRHETHEFPKLPGLDKAIRKIVGTPKEEVDRRDAAAKKRRARKR